MAYKLMYLPNDDTQNYLLFRFKLVVRNIWTLNLIKQPIKFNKVFKFNSWFEINIFILFLND